MALTEFCFDNGANMEYFVICVVFFILGLEGIDGKECIERIQENSRTFTCPAECCGEIFQRSCCPIDNPIPIEAIIAGITVGAVLLVALVVGGFVYLCKKPSQTRVVVYPLQEDPHETAAGKDPVREENYRYATDNTNSNSYTGPVQPGYRDY